MDHESVRLGLEKSSFKRHFRTASSLPWISLLGNDSRKGGKWGDCKSLLSNVHSRFQQMILPGTMPVHSAKVFRKANTQHVYYTYYTDLYGTIWVCIPRNPIRLMLQSLQYSPTPIIVNQCNILSTGVRIIRWWWLYIDHNYHTMWFIVTISSNI